MSTEYDIASALARDGLQALRGVMESIMSFEPPIRVKYARELTEVVRASTMVMKEEREQLEFEEKAKLAPEDIREALKTHLASMSIQDFRALVADARPELVPMLARAGEAEAHA